MKMPAAHHIADNFPIFNLSIDGEINYSMFSTKLVFCVELFDIVRCNDDRLRFFYNDFR